MQSFTHNHSRAGEQPERIRRKRVRTLVASGAVGLLAVGGLVGCSSGSSKAVKTDTGSNSGKPLSTGTSKKAKKKPKIDTGMVDSNTGGLNSGTRPSKKSTTTSRAPTSGSASTYSDEYFSFEVPAGYETTDESGYIAAYTSDSRSAEILVSSPTIIKGATSADAAAQKLQQNFQSKGYSSVQQDIEHNLQYGSDTDSDFILSNPSTNAAVAASVVIHAGTPVLVLALFDDYSNHQDVTGDLAHISKSWTWNF